MNDHHGVGLRLEPFMDAQYGSGGMSALTQIKHALDPKNILCPGKLGL
jgi:FAD/FMN-containing dehydrogenase